MSLPEGPAAPLDPGKCICPHFAVHLLSSLLSSWAPGRTCSDPFCGGLLISADGQLDNVKYDPKAQSMRNSHAFLVLRTLSSESLTLPLSCTLNFPGRKSACLWSSLQSTFTFFLGPESSTSLLDSPNCKEYISKLSKLSPWNSPQQAVVEVVPSLLLHQNGGWNSTRQQFYPKKPLH